MDAVIHAFKSTIEAADRSITARRVGERMELGWLMEVSLRVQGPLIQAADRRQCNLCLTPLNTSSKGTFNKIQPPRKPAARLKPFT